MAKVLALLLPLLLAGCFPIVPPPDETPPPGTEVTPPSACASLPGDSSCTEHPGCAVFECGTCGGQTALCDAADAPPTDVCGPAPSCPREVDCTTIPTDVGELSAANNGCDIDADCALVTTGCGLPGECGVSMNAQAAGLLTYELDVWNASCVTGCVPASCDDAPLPRCVSGTCM